MSASASHWSPWRVRPERRLPPDSFCPGHSPAHFDAYDDAEAQYADRRDRYEVLLVGATSLESIKATHGRFFRQDGHDTLVHSD